MFNPDIRYGEDLELWARIASRYPIACLPEVHLLRRKHAENATQATALMLTDLIKATMAVRSWGATQLREQGLDPGQLVANAWADLGYWYFSSGDLKKAGEAFHQSLREKISVRSVIYRFACMLPHRAVYTLRYSKQWVMKTSSPEE